MKTNLFFFEKLLILSAIHFNESADFDKTAYALSVAVMISIVFFTVILLVFLNKRSMIYLVLDRIYPIYGVLTS